MRVERRSVGVAGRRERVGNGNDNEEVGEKIRRRSRIPRDSSCERQMSIYIFIGGWRLSVGFALAFGRLQRQRTRAYTDTALGAYNKGSVPPLAKGCAAPVQGLRDFISGILLPKGSATRSTYMAARFLCFLRDRICTRVYVRVFVFVHAFTYVHTRAHRAQQRFSVVLRPFKQAKEILRRTLGPRVPRCPYDATTFAS